jgi:aryl-phospho-beta-D-glucosidase BglC (GH1 family)
MRFYILLFFAFLPRITSIIKGLSIFGLETEYNRNQGGGFMCEWVKPIDYYIDVINDLNFNLIRVPISFDYIQRNNFNKLDYIIDLTEQRNISVIIDMHRIQPNFQCPDPFCTGLTIDQFIQGWFIVLDRYTTKMNVIGSNAWNEYQGTDKKFLMDYTTKVFQAIEDRYGERYLHYVVGDRWGGTLEGISLEHLPFKERIFYSCHKYPFSKGDDFTTYEQDWDKSIPYELNDKIIIGEWNWGNENERWFGYKFINYLKKRNITNTIWWALSQSGDTIDLFQDDCLTINWQDYDILKTLWEDKRYLRTNNDCFHPIIPFK